MHHAMADRPDLLDRRDDPRLRRREGLDDERDRRLVSGQRPTDSDLLAPGHLVRQLGALAPGDRVPVREALRQARVGTVVHVITTGDQQRAQQVLSGLAAVESAHIRDGAVVLTLNSDTTDFSFLAEALIQNRLPIQEIKQEEVNLETAFMRLTKGIVQ